jgi:hypothetical protein
MRPRLAAVALSLLLLLTAVSPVAAWSSGYANWPAEHALKTKLDKEFLDHCGRKLRSNLTLILIARERARDMAVNGYLGHRIPPDGHYVSREVRAAGIRTSRVGEIAHYNGYGGSYTAHFAWLSFARSGPHHQVMRNCAYRSVGVGSFRYGWKRMYVAIYVR